MKWLRPAAVASLLAAGLLVQLHFLRHYPQPILFGDPAGYYAVGERFQEALGKVSRGEDPRAVFESVRGLMYLAAVGTLFAVLDGLRPGDFAFFRTVMAGFNTLAMLGAFLLGRRLSGRFAGGLLALALAAFYPSFSVQTGRLYPDPLTGCLFVWAAWLYLEAWHRRRSGLMAAAAAVFMTALIVRSQVMVYLTVVVALVLAGSAFWWARSAEARRLVAGFVLGALPFLGLWAFIVRSVGERDDVVQLGNATFKAPYLFGFWQYLETDGWIGPYRFKTEPYYEALVAAGREDGQLLRSRPRQAVFALRYAARRPRESALLVLDNAYRLYDRPANDYKWDYPIPYPWQVVLQRAILVLALLGLPLLAAGRPAVLGVYLLPLALAVLHGLVFSWPRYNLPAMPILIGAAGASLTLLASGAWSALQREGRPTATWRAVGLTLGLGLCGLAAGTAARDAAPEAARAARVAGTLLASGALFLLAARLPSRRSARGALAMAAGGALGLLVTAHALRDRRWHEVATVLDDDTPAVEQEIALPPEARAAVRAASEAFLVFDLRVPRGDVSGLVIEVGGRHLPGTALQPTMPRLRESTTTGGRDWRGYPQWWALSLDEGLREEAAGESLRVRLRRESGPPLTLGGDRFRDQHRVYEGPSFGDWPNVVPLKLEYDGDYRLAVRHPLKSAATRSFVWGPGGKTPIRAVHRVRVVTLAQNEGALRFSSAPLPRGPHPALCLAAYSGDRGNADLWLDGARWLSFPLQPPGDFVIEAARGRLCYRAEGDRGGKPYGSYFLLDPPGAPGVPLGLEVRFRAGMSVEPMRFVVDRRRPPAEIAALLARCAPAAGTQLAGGFARMGDATRNNYPEDTGRWRVAGVY